MVTHFDQYAVLGKACVRFPDVHIGTGADGDADNKVIDSSHKVTHALFMRLALL
jgi:hypothetical protein